MNGRGWTKEEDAALARTIAERGSTLRLADDMGRSHVAVIARAGRLGIKLDIPPSEPGPVERR